MTKPTKPTWLDSSFVIAAVTFAATLAGMTAKEAIGQKLGTANHEIRINTIEERAKIETDKHQKHEEKLYETARLLTGLAGTVEQLMKNVDRLDRRATANGT